jgi:hypothetical protein
MITSPAASGKTSLLNLLTERLLYEGCYCYYISMLRPSSSATELLAIDTGIDLTKAVLSEDSPINDYTKRFVVMIDDAQAKFSEVLFWESLIKSAGGALPGSSNLYLDNVQFVICSTFYLKTTGSPVDFQSFPGVGMPDMKLTLDESNSFINLEGSGLFEWLLFP